MGKHQIDFQILQEIDGIIKVSYTKGTG